MLALQTVVLVPLSNDGPKSSLGGWNDTKDTEQCTAWRLTLRLFDGKASARHSTTLTKLNNSPCEGEEEPLVNRRMIYLPGLLRDIMAYFPIHTAKNDLSYSIFFSFLVLE